MPPSQTILGLEFFEIASLSLIQHIFSWILSCRNMALRSKNTVSEHDTLIQEYRVGTWHSDPKILCRNVILRSKNIVSERDTPIQEYRVETWHSDPRILYYLSFTIIIFQFIDNLWSSHLYSKHYFDREVSTYKSHGLRISDQSQITQRSHTITPSRT